MALIASIMKSRAVTAAPGETVRIVVERMRASRIGAVLVVEDGELEGIFTERDLLTRVVAQGRDASATRVGEVATREPLAVDVGTPVRDCVRILRERGFRHLPVLEHGRPVGILSARDLLDLVVAGFERFVDQRLYESSLAGGVDPYDHVGGAYGG